MKCTMILAAMMMVSGLGAALQDAPPAQDAQQEESTSKPEVDRRWLAALDALDRRLLDELVGHAPPTFTDDLEWLGGEPLDLRQMRGRVIVIQTWTTSTRAGETLLRRAGKATERYGEDVVLIALHTPEGAEHVRTYLERRAMPGRIVIDANGSYCDLLGAFRQPVSIVVDRQGAVRGAGVKPTMLDRVVDTLIEEEFDPDAPAPAPFESKQSDVEFPPITGPVQHATDMRGQRAPTFHAEQWITAAPKMDDRVVVVDFWATWCGPCLAMTPHMNELARTFGADVAIVGLTDESRNEFLKGMREGLPARQNMTTDSFHYALALDSRGRMKKTLNITGIPHVIVISRDWIIRWQGHPSQLTAEVMRRIVEADAGAFAGRPRRWAESLRGR